MWWQGDKLVTFEVIIGRKEVIKNHKVVLNLTGNETSKKVKKVDNEP